MRGSLFATRRRQRPHCRTSLLFHRSPSPRIDVKRTKALDFQQERPGFVASINRVRANLHKYPCYKRDLFFGKLGIDFRPVKIGCVVFSHILISNTVSFADQSKPVDKTPFDTNYINIV